MNIYLISQYENTGYNTYNTAVVIAESERRPGLRIPLAKRSGLTNPGRTRKTLK